MTVRPYRESDRPSLEAFAGASGFPYCSPDSPMVEAVLVVTDEQDRPVMAAAAERIVQMYLWCGDFPHPACKLAAIRALDESMAPYLKAKGYNGVEAFLPPQLERSFGRRLERVFGWKRNWQSWNKGV